MINQIAPVPSAFVRLTKGGVKNVPKPEASSKLPKIGQLWDPSMPAPYSAPVIRWIP